MNIWGVGIELLLYTFLYGCLTFLLDRFSFNTYKLHLLPDFLFYSLSGILMVVGLPFIITSGRKITRHFTESRLIVDGVFSYVRNPIYSAWILFLIPSICLLTKSLFVMTTPLVTYAIFRGLIKKEELYLESQFGDEYLNYKKKVNQLIPGVIKKRKKE